MAVTTNIGLHIYTDNELESTFESVRQWRNQIQGNNSSSNKSDMQKIDEAIGDLQAKKTVNTVNSLPTADATEYAKHLLYDYNNSLYFIIYSNSEYSYVQVGKDYTSGTNINIVNGVINATDTTYTAGNNVAIDSTDNNKISVTTLKFTNVTASSWVSDNTYQDFGYKCEIACQGVTIDMYIEVVFGVAEATSGNYAPICASDTNKVTIYSKVNDSITIPLIKEVV